MQSNAPYIYIYREIEIRIVSLMIRRSIMGHKKKLVMSFRYTLLVGCLLATMTAITLFVPNSVPFNACKFVEFFSGVLKL